jgi:DNA-binding response OmpR family regulator
MDQLEILSGLVQHSGLTSLLPEPELQAESPASPPPKILVLEDDPLQLDLLRQHLEAVNFQVTAAMSIAEARHRLSEQKFQLAIFDVQLPDGSGFELCEHLDGDATYAGLPVIVLSSLTETNAIRRTRAAGGRFFLSKPYDPNVLLAIIEHILEDR